ncbi:MAG: GNAT family N-acyltransferase [Paracoccaceae bacterium]
MPNLDSHHFSIRLASTEAEKRAAHRLRYDVFVAELGGDGELVDHTNQLEHDRFDPFFDNLILIDEKKGNVVGLYRLLDAEQAKMAGQFYSEDEYDLNVLKASGRRLLELGRSCLHKDYRGGMAMFHLWNGLASYIKENDIEILFGVASFHGTNPKSLAHPLSFLHQKHLAPRDLRVRARESHFTNMDIVPPEKLDRRRAARETPALIKAYLRLGGYVGDGAFVDLAFNTTDVCLVMDTARMNQKQAALYRKAQI